MAEVRLVPIRPNFDWSTEFQFPTGFLQIGESVRGKLRRFKQSADVFVCTDERVGDNVTLSLAKGQTNLMLQGSYVLELVAYKPLDPLYAEIPLTTNRYVVDCNRSPSE